MAWQGARKTDPKSYRVIPIFSSWTADSSNKPNSFLVPEINPTYLIYQGKRQPKKGIMPDSLSQPNQM